MLVIENLYYKDADSRFNFKIPFAKFNPGDAVLIEGETDQVEILINTLLGKKRVAGLTIEYSGEICNSIKRQSMFQELSDCFYFYQELSLLENINYFAGMLNLKKSDIRNKLNWLLRYFDIYPILDKKVSKCSNTELLIAHFFLSVVNLPKILIISYLMYEKIESIQKEKFEHVFRDLQESGMIVMYKNSWKNCFKANNLELKIQPSVSLPGLS